MESENPTINIVPNTNNTDSNNSPITDIVPNINNTESNNSPTTTTCAHTIIGLKVNLTNLKITAPHKHATCNCKNNTVDFKFCPDCGNLNRFGECLEEHYIDNFIVNYGNKNVKQDPTRNKNNICVIDSNHILGILVINKALYNVLMINNTDPFGYVTIYHNHSNNKNYDNTACSLESLCVIKKDMLANFSALEVNKDDKFEEHFNKNFGIFTLLFDM